MISRRSVLAAAAPIAALTAPQLIKPANASLCSQLSLPQNYIGLGDIYGPALGYWGLRAFSAVYAAATGPVIRIQRAWDNSSKDIHVLSNGLLDFATAESFLTGTNGGISIWYDQSGNGRHHQQTNQALQPQFSFNAAGGNPGIVFISGGHTFLENTIGIPDMVAPVTFSHYVQPQMASARNVNYIAFDSVNGGNQGYQVDGFGVANLWAFFWSNVSVPVSNNAWHSSQLRLAIGQNASAINFDGLSISETFEISAQAKLLSGSTSIGCDISGAACPCQEYFNGPIAEIGVFPIAASSNQMAAASSNQAMYCGVS